MFWYQFDNKFKIAHRGKGEDNSFDKYNMRMK